MRRGTRESSRVAGSSLEIEGNILLIILRCKEVFVLFE